MTELTSKYHAYIHHISYEYDASHLCELACALQIQPYVRGRSVLDTTAEHERGKGSTWRLVPMEDVTSSSAIWIPDLITTGTA
jgi:hypothetical protein